MTADLFLDIAVRAYPIPPSGGRKARRDPGPPGQLVVVFDTETRTDLTQRLLFGSYRIHNAAGRLIEEGLSLRTTSAPTSTVSSKSTSLITHRTG